MARSTVIKCACPSRLFFEGDGAIEELKKIRAKLKKKVTKKKKPSR